MLRSFPVPAAMMETRVPRFPDLRVPKASPARMLPSFPERMETMAKLVHRPPDRKGLRALRARTRRLFPAPMATMVKRVQRSLVLRERRDRQALRFRESKETKASRASPFPVPPGRRDLRVRMRPRFPANREMMESRDRSSSDLKGFPAPQA
jgi:hypothetical protein